MAGLIKFTFRKYAVEMTELNAAFSYNFRNAIIGTSPDYDIDFQKALVSRGELPNVNTPLATVTGTVIFYTWQDNSGTGTAAGTDIAIMVVFCRNLNLTIYSTTGTRADGASQIDVANFKGETVETWLAFLSIDTQEVSNSVYTGQLAIPLS